MVKNSSFIETIFLSLLGLSLFCTISICSLPEKKLFIIITSYNNAEWCIKNLESIFMQKNPDNTGFYENYTVVVVDDDSFDGNAEYIEHYIYTCNQQHRVTLIKNKTRQRALANIYMALQLCEDPTAIVFNIDGDDFLAHDRVFSLINEIYHDPKEVWITYGQFINWPTNEMGYCQPISDEIVEKQLFRKKWWKPGQLRTFYAWLFQQIHLKDLLFEGPYFQGQFFPANSDLAIYYPMMEKACRHYQFIPDVIYIRNVATPLNDFKVNKEIQILGSKLIREKPAYPRLEKACPHYFDTFKDKKANILLFAHTLATAQCFINSVDKLALGVDQIYVLLPIFDKRARGLPSSVYSTSHPIKSLFFTPTTLKNILLELLDQNSQDYLLLATDHTLITGYINCSECILALEKAFAYAFYFNLGDNHTYCVHNGRTEPIPPLNYIKDATYAWGFQYANGHDWRMYNTIEGALYRTQQFFQQIMSLEFSTPEELVAQWQKVTINLEEVGLCFEQSKISYIHSL